jgi:hypothetical protein
MEDVLVHPVNRKEPETRNSNNPDLIFINNILIDILVLFNTESSGLLYCYLWIA